MADTYVFGIKCIDFYVEKKTRSKSGKPEMAYVVQRTLFINQTSGFSIGYNRAKIFVVMKKGCPNQYSLRIKKLIPQNIWQNPAGPKAWTKEDTEWTPEVIGGKQTKAMNEDEFFAFMSARFGDRAPAVIRRLLTEPPVKAAEYKEGKAMAA